MPIRKKLMHFLMRRLENIVPREPEDADVLEEC